MQYLQFTAIRSLLVTGLEPVAELIALQVYLCSLSCGLATMLIDLDLVYAFGVLCSPASISSAPVSQKLIAQWLARLYQKKTMMGPSP